MSRFHSVHNSHLEQVLPARLLVFRRPNPTPFLLSFLPSLQAILISKCAFGGVRIKSCSGIIACVYIYIYMLISILLTHSHAPRFQVATHSAIFDFFPERRHALRATPHAERPMSVAQYELVYGRKANDRQKEVWKQQGYDAALTRK